MLPQINVLSSETQRFSSQTVYNVNWQAYATVLYDGITPVVSSAHAILTVNGVVRTLIQFDVLAGYVNQRALS